MRSQVLEFRPNIENCENWFLIFSSTFYYQTCALLTWYLWDSERWSSYLLIIIWVEIDQRLAEIIVLSGKISYIPNDMVIT